MTDTFNFNKYITNMKTSVTLEQPIYLTWTLSSGSIGHLSFTQEGDTIRCHSDGLTKQEIKNILCTLVDDSSMMQ